MARARAVRLAVTRAAIAARMPAPIVKSSGSACWTGRGDGEIRVGYQLQSSHRRLGVRAADDDPAQLQMGKAAGLRQPAQAEDAGRRGQRRLDRGRLDAARIALEGVVGEHLVGDDRQAGGGRDRGQTCRLVASQEAARRIVRVDDDDRPRPRAARPRVGQRLFDAGEVDAPDTVERQAIADRHGALQADQVVVQRVARLRDQDRVARVAQQLEQERARFAGAGGDRDARRVDGGSGRRVRRGDCRARGRQTERRRFVARRVACGRAPRAARRRGRGARPGSGSIRSGPAGRRADGVPARGPRARFRRRAREAAPRTRHCAVV